MSGRWLSDFWRQNIKRRIEAISCRFKPSRMGFSLGETMADAKVKSVVVLEFVER